MVIGVMALETELFSDHFGELVFTSPFYGGQVPI